MRNIFCLTLIVAFVSACTEAPIEPHDWEDQSIIGINKLPARSHYFPYESLELAENRALNQSNRFFISRWKMEVQLGSKTS